MKVMDDMRFPDAERLLPLPTVTFEPNAQEQQWLDDAVAAAKTSAGLKADADVDLLMLPEAKTIFEQLFGDSSASTDADSLMSEGLKLLQQSRMLRQMLSQRILTWMPYEVEVK